MPSAIVHRVVARNVLIKANLYSNESDAYLYEVGAIAPDSWRNTKRFKDSLAPKIEKRLISHFSEPGSFLEHYNIFIDKYKEYLDNPFILGYLVHLMTDYVAHKSILYQSSIKDKSEEKEFRKKKAKLLNYLLQQDAKLDDLRLLTDDEIASLPPIDELEYDGINTTIAFINKELKLIDFDITTFDKAEELCDEIDTWSDIIIEDLNKYRDVKVKKL